MKKSLLLLFFAITIFQAKAGGTSCGINVNATVTGTTCFESTDGSISITVSGGTVPQTSTKGLLISEFMADPTGNDSPNEFIELVATKNIDFSITPYTIVFNNNNVATANGWAQGAAITYAFQISSGTVSAGDIIYVGGSGMIPTDNVFRAIDYRTVTGDGGIGNVSATAGVLGNGGNNADGVAVFNVAANLLTAGTVPIDAVFFGLGMGTAVVNSGLDGYQLPINDHYNGGKLQSNSFFINSNPVSGLTFKATGEYDVTTNTFTVPRTWVNNATFSDGVSSVGLAQLYSFQWNDGSTTQSIQNLTGGTYCVTITDASSCNQVECFNVLEPDEIAVNITFFDASCANIADGGATVLLFGGTPGYSFLWSNGATTQNLSGVVAGDYDLTVTDANNCTAEATAFIGEPDPIEFDLLITDVSCFGANDGKASVQNLTGGSGPLEIVYLETNGTIGITDGVGNAESITPGEFGVAVYETNNPSCSVIENFIIVEPALLVANTTLTPITCSGDNDAEIAASATGGTAPYLYEWADDNSIDDALRTDLSEGVYEVTITDNKNCTASASVTIINPDPIELTFNVTDASAQNNADGAIELTVIGGIAAYTYTWSTGATTQNLENVLPNEYCVTVTDVNGCEVFDCAEVDFTVGINELNSDDIVINAAIENNQFLASIQFTEKATLSIEVYNINGAIMIAETNANSNELNIQKNTANWAKGVYMVRFSANNKTMLKKLLIQ